MGSSTDAPVELYVAAYDDPDAARGDWDAMKQLAQDDVIEVDGLVLVSRGADGKIDVDDDFHEARKGAAWGAVGGAVVGLIFPPAVLASAAVGAGIGRAPGRCCRTATRPRSRPTSRTRCRPAAPASSRSSRSNGPTTSRRRSRTPATSPRSRSTATARSRSRLQRPRSCCPGPRAWSDRRRAVVDSYIRVGRARASARCGARTMVGPGGWGALSTAMTIEGMATRMATRPRRPTRVAARRRAGRNAGQRCRICR